MVSAYVALGGNVGNVPETFRRTVELLRSAPGTYSLRESRHYVTDPVGSAAGGTFHNAAVAFETDLSAIELLDLLQSIETSLGRVRHVHWGPRTLDLDIVFYGQAEIDVPRLTVPHRHCWYRRFVLEPLCDLGAHVVHPTLQQSVEQLRQRLRARPFRIHLAGEHATNVSSTLGREFSEVEFVPLAKPRELEQGLGIWMSQTSQPRPHFWLWTTPQDAESVTRDVVRAACGDIKPIAGA